MQENLYEIRIHGRGGQGVVTAAYLIALAVHTQGKYAQAFPNFGVERQGAPIEAYARISNKPILLRSQIYNPQAIIIADETLLSSNVDVFFGVAKDTLILINTKEKKELSKNIPVHIKKVVLIDAARIALQYIGRPIFNTVLLGAFAAASDLFSFEDIKKAIKERFKEPELALKNILAMEAAYRQVTDKRKLEGGQNFKFYQ